VLRLLKRRSLAVLRHQVEPVETQALARFLPHWQGMTRPRRGLDGLLDVVQQLQGLPLPASTWEQHVLPSRLADYRPADLDELCAAGEIVWRGIDSLGPGDGRIALYLTDHLPRLAPPAEAVTDPLGQQVQQVLSQRGAVFFSEITRSLGGFPNDILDALWQLVWAGHVTNDTLAPLRSLYRQHQGPAKRAARNRRAFRSRRRAKTPGSEGRWSLLDDGSEAPVSPTERQTALATQWIERYGILTRELVASEAAVGGFSAFYPVLKAMEEAGKIRRGYFVEGLGAAQFAAPGAEDQLREFSATLRPDEASADVLVMAATDPANPYGAAWRWPTTPDSVARPQRAAGARVILLDGALIGYVSRTGQQVTTFPSPTDPDPSRVRRVLAQTLATIVPPEQPVFLTRVNGRDVGQSELSADLLAAGFAPTPRGYLRRRTLNQ
jgi:ATP-dependent Lhr-like helicase